MSRGGSISGELAEEGTTRRRFDLKAPIRTPRIHMHPGGASNFDQGITRISDRSVRRLVSERVTCFDAGADAHRH